MGKGQLNLSYGDRKLPSFQICYHDLGIVTSNNYPRYTRHGRPHRIHGTSFHRFSTFSNNPRPILNIQHNPLLQHHETTPGATHQIWNKPITPAPHADFMPRNPVSSFPMRTTNEAIHLIPSASTEHPTMQQMPTKSISSCGSTYLLRHSPLPTIRNQTLKKSTSIYLSWMQPHVPFVTGNCPTTSDIAP